MGSETQIVTFDFDDTMDVKSKPYPAIGEENHLMLNVIKTHIKRGDTIILNTMREGTALNEALRWLIDRGIAPDAVNDNCEAMKREYNNNPRKIHCDVNYDNKNFDWLNDSMRWRLEDFSAYGDDDASCSTCCFWDNPDDNGETYNHCTERDKQTKYCYWCRDWENV